MAYTKYKEWKYLEIMLGVYPGIGFGAVAGIDNDPLSMDVEREIHVIIGVLCFYVGFEISIYK